MPSILDFGARSHSLPARFAFSRQTATIAMDNSITHKGNEIQGQFGVFQSKEDLRLGGLV